MRRQLFLMLALSLSGLLSDHPAAANSPPPWTLERLTRAADGIAVVRVEPLGPPDQWQVRQQPLTVERWLKQPPEQTGATLLSFQSPDTRGLPPSYQPGARFLIFFNHIAFGDNPSGQHLFRIRPTGGITKDQSPGLFEIHRDRIGYAGLPAYQGWVLARMETTIREILVRPAPSLRDPHSAALAALVQYADFVAEVDIVNREGSGGFSLHKYAIREWLKRPPAMTGDLLDTRVGRNGAQPDIPLIDMADSSDHRVMFALGRVEDLFKTPIAVYGIRNGYVETESFYLYDTNFQRPHSYVGWPADRFLAAVRAATQSAAALPQSGNPAPAFPAPVFLVALTALLLGMLLRRRA